ncbi:MAG: DUF1289 domain-containing protein [Alphaproteobacteria bacterium]|nr:DUF1289 domain-containing protein [Alphaproteobacteria bacterium]
MTDEVPLPSPCVSVCILDGATGFCRGCWRTIDEIRVWAVLDNAERMTVLEGLRARRQAAGLASERRLNRRRTARPPVTAVDASGMDPQN